MADITSLFKATVKAIKVRETNIDQIEKSSGVNSINPRRGSQPQQSLSVSGSTAGPSVTTHPTHPPAHPPPHPPAHPVHQSEFTQQAKGVIANIKSLHEYLVKYRKDYLNTNGHLGSEASKLTDSQRDEIDSEAELCMRTCVDAIRQLKIQANNHKVLRQVKEHKDGVLDIIDKYLCSVCQLYSEQKAVRVKRVVDHKRLARLEGNHSSVSSEKRSTRSTASVQNEGPSLTAAQDHTESPVRQVNDLKSLMSGGGAVGGASQKSSHNSSLTQSPSVIMSDQSKSSPDQLLSVEEEQMLQLENDQVFAELSDMVDEVRQVEGKLVEISRLQEIFSNKILQQETDINNIADTVVGTTENIKDANEEIREAMKNNAGFRIWILFFLIVCSCSLLFLDWYNA